MAAANALLRAAGFLEKSTATEHATSSSRPGPVVRCEKIVYVLGSKENPVPLGDIDLKKIVALLMWMAQDFVVNSGISSDDVAKAALAAVLNYGDPATEGSRFSLHAESIVKLAELIDIMMLHKDGSVKDPNDTLTFMKRVAVIREEVLDTLSDNATERVERATSSYNATEHVELDQQEVSLCYQLFGRILLTEDLLPHQKKNPKYQLRNKFPGDTTVTSSQRSWIDSMLRKMLGDKKVAFLIWQHGMPSIADTPSYKGIYYKKYYKGMLQSSLNECLDWYSSLANQIVVHRDQEGFDVQLRASSLNTANRLLHQTRRESLQKVQHTLLYGATLAKQSVDGKRSYDDMDVIEQKILEDFETGKTKKAKQHFTTSRMKPFRCKLG